MCGTTRRAMRRSNVDSSDELDFVASAYCSLCISKTPAPLIRESTGTDARLKPRVRRATVFQKTALSGDCRHVVVQEKNFSWLGARSSLPAFGRAYRTASGSERVCAADEEFVPKPAPARYRSRSCPACPRPP